MKKILISHFGGNANTRAVVDGLGKAGLLKAFIVSVAVFKSAWYYSFLNFPLFKEFKKRTFNDILRKYTHAKSYVGLGRLICQKLKVTSLLQHETGRFCVDKECEYIDRETAKYLQKHSGEVDAVYCYEDVALHTFRNAKSLGKKCLFDEPIGYWRYMRELLDDERTKNPEWAVTLGGFRDSDEKLKRKDEELRLADKIYCASSFTKRSLESFPEQLADIVVVPYGFPPVNDEREYIPFEGRKIKLLYVGGLSQRKGISYIFEAIEGLEDKVELTVAGAGNIEGCPALKGALSTVNYVGTKPHDEILKLMAEHDVLLFPSLFEGFGLVVTEAMSQGTPVVTTDRTCGPDVITHGVDGWIVEAGTSKPIRELVEHMIEEPSMMETVGRKARETARKRPWRCYEDEMVASIKKFLQ